MKKILFCAAIAMVSLQACDKQDDDNGYVSQQAKQALSAKYPDAKRIEWEVKQNYVVADFSNKSREVSAWFDNNGNWYMTETDILFKDLPEAVKASFSAGAHGSWRVEDVDQIERNATETVYVVEAEKQQSEVDLYYSADGALVKQMIDADDNYDYEDYIPSVIPSSIDSFLKTNYPNSTILDIDNENGYTTVEILDARVKRELIFDSKNAWVSTHTELRLSDVPAAIQKVLTDSKYGTYRVEDVDHYQTPTSEYYRFDLELSGVDVNVDITSDGILTVVGNK